MVNQMELARVEIHQGKIVAMKKWCNNCKRFYYWDPEVQPQLSRHQENKKA